MRRIVPVEDPCPAQPQLRDVGREHVIPVRFDAALNPSHESVERLPALSAVEATLARPRRITSMRRAEPRIWRMVPSSSASSDDMNQSECGRGRPYGVHVTLHNADKVAPHFWRSRIVGDSRQEALRQVERLADALNAACGPSTTRVDFALVNTLADLAAPRRAGRSFHLPPLSPERREHMRLGDAVRSGDLR